MLPFHISELSKSFLTLLPRLGKHSVLPCCNFQHPARSRGAHRLGHCVRSCLQRCRHLLQCKWPVRHTSSQLQWGDLKRHGVCRLLWEGRLSGRQRWTLHSQEQFDESARPSRRRQLGLWMCCCECLYLIHISQHQFDPRMVFMECMLRLLS